MEPAENVAQGADDEDGDEKTEDYKTRSPGSLKMDH